MSNVPHKYQSPEFVHKMGIHSEDPVERSRAYANHEDRTGTLGVAVTYVKSKGKVVKYVNGKKAK